MASRKSHGKCVKGIGGSCSFPNKTCYVWKQRLVLP